MTRKPSLEGERREEGPTDEERREFKRAELRRAQTLSGEFAGMVTPELRPTPEYLAGYEAGYDAGRNGGPDALWVAENAPPGPAAPPGEAT